MAQAMGPYRCVLLGRRPAVSDDDGMAGVPVILLRGIAVASSSRRAALSRG